jgi:hypothetical protein
MAEVDKRRKERKGKEGGWWEVEMSEHAYSCR